MIEAFLINPPKRLGYAKKARARLKRLKRGATVAGEGRLWKRGLKSGKLMHRLYGPAHQKRWTRANPFGEEIMIVGANPRKQRTPRRRARIALNRKEVISNMFGNPRKRRVGRPRTVGRKRKRTRRTSIASAFDFMGRGRPTRRRRRRTTVARRRRRVAAYAPIRRRRRRRAVAYAPVRRRRRRRAVARYLPVRRPRRQRVSARRRRRVSAVGAPRRRRRLLRNPPAVASLTWRRPMSLLMPAAIGTAAFLVTEQAPAYIGMAGVLPRYGIKAAVMIGGGMAVSKFLGARNGQIWMLGSLINIASDLVRQYIFKTGMAGLGYGAFPYQGLGYAETGYTPYTEYGAYPSEFSSPYES